MDPEVAAGLKALQAARESGVPTSVIGTLTAVVVLLYLERRLLPIVRAFLTASARREREQTVRLRLLCRKAGIEDKDVDDSMNADELAERRAEESTPHRTSLGSLLGGFFRTATGSSGAVTAGLLLVAFLTLALASGCGVTKEEHRAFVEAGEKFRDAVLPAYRRDLERLCKELDAEVAERTRANREGAIADFDRALSAARERLK